MYMLLDSTALKMTSVHVETIGDNDGFKLNREKLC